MVRISSFLWEHTTSFWSFSFPKKDKVRLWWATLRVKLVQNPSNTVELRTPRNPNKRIAASKLHNFPTNGQKGKWTYSCQLIRVKQWIKGPNTIPISSIQKCELVQHINNWSGLKTKCVPAQSSQVMRTEIIQATWDEHGLLSIKLEKNAQGKSVYGSFPSLVLEIS